MRLIDLQEAKYHRNLSVYRANIAYQSAYSAALGNDDNIAMALPSVGGRGPGGNKFAYVDIVVYDVENQQDATHAVKRFVEKYKIPYTTIHEPGRRTDARDIPYWRVSVSYENTD